MVQEYTNRLINEKSPYLLEHAHNPVDWYSWGTEAFDKAEREDKPIFLSIGYSTCHWCHVMERESFEDREIAKILNRYFISIKVDREERPDIDAVYMKVCQSITGSGGWPLTIIMTPDQKPFFAGTYIPKKSRYGITGMNEILPLIAQQWKENKQNLVDMGDKIIYYLNNQQREPYPDDISVELIHNGAEMFKDNFDRRYGGFGGAPKFPSPHNLLFLLRYSYFENDKNALDMVEKTLTQMYRGGIFDHIGGGFSRYSTDDKWLIPHFEKMLYDNALLTIAYLEAYQMTGRELYKNVAEKTINYVLNELRDKDGGFYCGQDADSDGVEGKYYALTPEEIREVLGEQNGKKFCKHFGISEKGNFEGMNIPNLIDNKDYDKQDPDIGKLCSKIYNYRFGRTRLHTDDKILTSWNSLMIYALAKASRILNNQSYLKYAESAAKFINVSLSDRTGRLYVRWRDREAAHAGQIDDYAFYCLALIELYNTVYDTEYLNMALTYAEKMVEGFFDKEKGGFYIYSDEGDRLITRPKEVYDGAIPSGNSVAAMVLIDLAALTGENVWSEYRDKQLKFLSSYVNEYPMGYSFSMLSFMRVLYPSYELICAAKEEEMTIKLKDFLNELPMANLNVLFKTEENSEKLSQIAPFTAQYPVPFKSAVYYLCHNGACDQPTDDIEKIKSVLSK